MLPSLFFVLQKYGSGTMTERQITAALRTRKVNPFKVMDVLERARQLESAGRSIVHLEVGEPDFTAHPLIVEAGVQAMRSGNTQYTPASGLPALRERIAEFYRQHHGVQVDASRIIVTPGASGALVLLSHLLLNPSDQVMMPDPAYPCNRNYVHLMGAEAVLIAPETPGLAAPTIAQLENARNERSKGLWLASPANPTGAVIDAAQMAELSDWTRQRGMHLVMDEIYHGLDFVKPLADVTPMGDLPTALQYNANNFVINSFSKYFGMTGWRVGWVVVPQAFSEMANILAQNLFIAASTPSQYAALSAFNNEVIAELEERRTEFRRRRDFLADALLQAGFSLPWQPQGAFYCYADIGAFADDCELFCQQMLEQHGVAMTPGTDFGLHQANRYVRLAYTRSLPDLEVAAQRIVNALQSR